ncbi:MAG: cupredoxin domain-containing protein [Candidatus Paceibacteria bacterium]|jgi:plastocyanin
MRAIISGVVVVVGIGIVFFLTTKQPHSEAPKMATNAEGELVVSAQNATTVVTVDSVTLLKPGFLAVRSIDNGRLGQIVEISQYLTTGTHNGIAIPLGDFYEGGEELIVMAYEDAGDDKVFNDLDQPLEVDGMPLSVYVATGAPVPTSITTNTGNADAIHMMGNSAMATIRYTDSGFEPKEVSVPLGTMVHFVNESTKEMWVASNEHPEHSILPTFDQFKTGDQYMYTFDKPGTWNYHDHLNPAAEGVVIVE